VLEFVDIPAQEDTQFEAYGARVFVDAKSLVYLDGLTVDWLKKGLNEGFEFINPNATGECGCGESFTV
jgi:iron-sulfur cluster assembly protein